MKITAAAFYEHHRLTGSISASFLHTLHVVAKKLPLLLNQISLIAKSHRSFIAIERGKAGNQPYLAFRIHGGIGDYIVTARFIRDFLDHIGGADFDLYCIHEEHARWIFTNVGGLRRVYSSFAFESRTRKYDAAAEVTHLVRFYPSWKRSKINRKWQLLADSIAASTKLYALYSEYDKKTPHLDSFIARKIIFSNHNRYTFLQNMVGSAVGALTLDIPVDNPLIDLSNKTYITVHNGFDPGTIVRSESATKCYPHFADVLKSIRKVFPHIAFVQLGTRTSRPIEGVDFDLRMKTSLREAAAIIRGAAFHLDNEGGLVHIASAFGVKSCVVFGPTLSAYYGYKQNINVEPVYCGGCWWITDSWMDSCPRGHKVAKCMHDQPPEIVAKKAVDALAALHLPLMINTSVIQHQGEHVSNTGSPQGDPRNSDIFFLRTQSEAGPAILTRSRSNSFEWQVNLVRALALLQPALPKARLFVLSEEGDDTTPITDLAATLGVAPFVFLLDQQPGVQQALAACDVFVGTSEDEPGSEMLIEAMIAGVPVIATDTVGSRRLLLEGALGTLAPPDDPHALAAAIISAVVNYRAARDRAVDAREHALVQHLPDHTSSFRRDTL
jgi:glycosyltransferase involved in cell wall biosynthesis